MSWIVGLMRENSEAVGFIPSSTVADRYVAGDRFVLQGDERGRRVGYLLHGAAGYGRLLTVAQHCVDVDWRNRGYGERAVRELVRRAEAAGASGIVVRCATDLPAMGFWQTLGFVVREVRPGGRRRGRSVARLVLPLSAPLLGEDHAARWINDSRLHPGWHANPFAALVKVARAKVDGDGATASDE